MRHPIAGLQVRVYVPQLTSSTRLQSVACGIAEHGILLRQSLGLAVLPHQPVAAQLAVKTGGG
ncbi:hypothetical protein D3C85_1866830 [compost metagenome]